MARQVYDKATGRLVWVNDDGTPVNFRNDPLGLNPGLGSLPGRAVAREVDIASRLPDAQLAGYRGPSVVNPQSMRGARPQDPDPVPPHTYRPLAGAKQNNRGGSKIVDVPIGTGVIEVGSIVETSRQGGDDAESIIVVCSYDDTRMPANAATAFSVEGFVEFGIGGASFVAEFDYVKGLSFALPASFVRVGASVVFSLLLDPGVLSLSAGLAYGSSPLLGASPLRKTFVDSIIAGGTSNARPIPNFASTVSLNDDQSSAASPNLSIQFAGVVFSGGSPVTTSSAYTMTSRSNLANQNDQFPVPAWATTFTVTNNAGVPVRATTCFGLAL